MSYKPEFFSIQELVPKAVYEARGEKAWELLDDRLLITLDELRRAFGSITVNNWASGGNRNWSGLRTAESPYGTEFSQHRFGRAADCLFNHSEVDIVRQIILTEPDRFPLIGAVELGTPHLHFDIRNCERIKTYYP